MVLNPDRIWNSSSLPTLPTVAMRLLDLVRDPETTIGSVVATIKADPALAAKLVKSANASYFGVRSEVKGVDRAVSLLGTTVSISMTLSFVLADDSMKAGPVSLHYRNFWKRSIVQAAAAECLGRRMAGQDPCELFLVGLLLDVGQLALLKTIPGDYANVLEHAEREHLSLPECEQSALALDHILVGAKLLENWKLPGTLVRACRAQNLTLAELLQLKGTAEFNLCAAAAAAAAVGDYFCGWNQGLSLERMRGLLPELTSTAIDVDAFLRDCEARIQQAGHLFEVDLADLVCSTDLMVLANEQLLQLTLREHVSNTQSQLKQVELTEENSRLEDQNRDLLARCSHDALTGLYNRNYFDDMLARESARCERQAVPLGVIFADVDHFKRLNDTYGHPFGDYVLREIAVRFRHSIRATDVLARYGGEELVILVYQPTEKGMQILADRIREKVATTPFEHQGLSVHVTCSIGVSLIIPRRRDVNIGQRLVDAADQAMYEAKHGGRNRTIFRSLLSSKDRDLQRQVTANRFSRWLVKRNLLDIAQVSQALLDCPPSTLRIGELARDRNLMTESQVREVLSLQLRSDLRFGEIALQHGLLNSISLVQLLAAQQECPRQLATVVVQSGLLAPDVAISALEEYLQDQRLQLAGVPGATLVAAH